jgi:P-type E1-E2 ATPase
VLVKDIGVMDSLACISTIECDKTGTLTGNSMTVSHLLMVNNSTGDNFICDANTLAEPRLRSPCFQVQFEQHGGTKKLV